MSPGAILALFIVLIPISAVVGLASSFRVRWSAPFTVITALMSKPDPVTTRFLWSAVTLLINGPTAASECRKGPMLFDRAKPLAASQLMDHVIMPLNAG